MSDDFQEPKKLQFIGAEPIPLIPPSEEEIEAEFGPEARRIWMMAQTYQELKELLIQLRDKDPTEIYNDNVDS